MKKKMTKKRMMKTTNNILLIVGVLFTIGSTAIFVLCMVLFAQNSQSFVVTQGGIVEGESVSFEESQFDVTSFRHLYKSQSFTQFNIETLSADSLIFIDVKTGDVLLSKNEESVHSIASLSKLVTALFLFEHGFDSQAQAQVGPETISSFIEAYDIPISANARISKINVEKSETFIAQDLLRATLIASANNAAFALVQSQGMSPNEFQSGIESYIAEQHAEHTVIKDPTGLHPQNVSTASEFAQLSLLAFKYPDIRKITTTASGDISSLSSLTRVKLQTTDRLLDSNAQEILAGKTGYLDEAQYTFVALVRHTSGRELLLVMFGADSSSQRFEESKKIIEWADVSYK